MATTLHLDYETRSVVDLKKSGAHVYAAHPSTRVLMLGWAVDDSPVRLWEPHRAPMPCELSALMHDPQVVCKAANAAFERLISHYCLGITIPYERWRCVLVKAYYLGFAGGLDDVLTQVGLRGKDPRGKTLINKFCKPAPKSHKADWYDYNTHPQEWEEFKAYCVRDVEVERDLDRWCNRYPAMLDLDWHQWFIDQSINDRGVPLDLDFAHAAIDLWQAERERLDAELRERTGLKKATPQPMLSYLNARLEMSGVRPLESLAKDYLASRLIHGSLPDNVVDLIKIYQEKAANAAAKYNAVLRCADTDGRARGMFQYKGASRTDRTSGRRLQLQNLKRPLAKSEEQIEVTVWCVKQRASDTLRAHYKTGLSQILGGSVRHAICAPPGKRLYVADLSSIESVLLGWLTNCELINKTFREGRDSYKVFAQQYYEVAYDGVTKEQRTFCKPPVLGCFAADTQVLTSDGWKPIQSVSVEDEVFDGHEFVAHGGVIDQGAKSCIKAYGVVGTPDHEFLTGESEWTQFKDLNVEKASRATALVTGLYSCISGAISGSAYAVASVRTRATSETYAREGLFAALIARTNCSRQKGLRPSRSESRKSTMIGWRGVFMRYVRAVKTRRTRATGTTEVAASGVYFPTQRVSSRTRVLSLGGVLRASRLIGSITTGLMLQAISVSSVGRRNAETKDGTRQCPTSACNTLRKISGRRTRANTATRVLSAVRSGRDLLLNRFCKTKKTVKVRTYDILNAGPRRRYVIRTDRGPMIVHNCGYMLGWLGLTAYAEGYGVQMSEQEARRAVDTFRGMYPEIPRFWRWLYDSIKAVVSTGYPIEGYRLHIERDEDFLRIRLPSGRNLSYHKPEIRPMPAPWDASQIIQNFTYMGMDDKRQWRRTAAHAGGVTENIIQSIAWDILQNGIVNAHHAGLHIVLQVHDELAGECDAQDAERCLTMLTDCMTRRPAWAPDLWLGASGFTTNRYTKD